MGGKRTRTPPTMGSTFPLPLSQTKKKQREKKKKGSKNGVGGANLGKPIGRL